MRVSRTRFSKRRTKRKTEFPIVAVVQKKRKGQSSPSQSFGVWSKRAEMPKEPKVGQSPTESAPEGGRSAPLSFAFNENKSPNRVTSPHGSKTRQNIEGSKPQKKSRASIDYKNVILLRNLITAEGKILPRRINKLTAKQQRCVQKAIKSARVMGLIPFINKSRPF